jgi:putative peptidoglycan lipid II flippase
MGLATLIMMASVFLSRGLGVVREATIAAQGGAGIAVDAYKTAFVLPEILNHIAASGFLSITFIPIFARYVANGDAEGGRRVFSIILTIFGVLLALLIGAAMLAAPQLLRWLAPGRDEPQFLLLATRMTRIVLPAQFFFFVGGLCMAVQFARQRFFLPALAPLIYNAGIIGGGLLLTPWLGVEGFSWGALIGAAIGHFGLQWIGARRTGLRFAMRWEFSHPDLRRYLVLTLPLILGLTMTFSTEIFSKFFGSFLSSGAISWIDFAWRVIMLLVGFFGQAVGVASFPFLAELAARNRIEEMNRLFNRTLRYLALMLPVCLLIWVLRYEIVGLLFERRHFTVVDTRMTALALSGMLPGAVAVAAQTVVNRGFYAIQNTLLPAAYGTLATVASLPLFWAGANWFGVAGVGAAISFSAIIQVAVLFAVWNKRSGNAESGGVYRFYGRMALISLPLGGVLWSFHYVMSLWMPLSSWMSRLSSIGLVTLVFALLMAAAAWLFRIEEVRVVVRKIGRKLIRRPQSQKQT